MLQALRHLVYLTGDRPVETLDLRARLQVDDAVAEEVECLLAYLLRVVPGFEHAALVEVVPDVVQLLHQLVVVGADLPLLVHLGQARRFEHLEDEHRVVGGQGASALGDDVRVGDVVLVGDVDKGRYGVVDVLLDGVVHAALAARRACPVIVHAQASADVDELHVEAHGVQLHIELRSLAQGGLDAAYLGDLATDVEVDEAQAVLHVLLLQDLQRFEQLARRESELAGVAAALLPLAAARRGELDAYAQVRPYVQLLGKAGYELELVHLLHDEEDALAHLLGEQGELDVALVLVAVADDERVAVGVHGYHRMQLRLRACLQSEVELLAVADDFFHYGAHLVDLDGVDDEVLRLVSVFLGGNLEAAGSLLDAVVQDVREADQHRG